MQDSEDQREMNHHLRLLTFDKVNSTLSWDLFEFTYYFNSYTKSVIVTNPFDLSIRYNRIIIQRCHQRR